MTASGYFSLGKKRDTNYSRLHIPGCLMNAPNNQRKDKMADEIWYMNIPEELLSKSAKQTCARLVDKWFDPTTEDHIR